LPCAGTTRAIAPTGVFVQPSADSGQRRIHLAALDLLRSVSYRAAHPSPLTFARPFCATPSTDNAYTVVAISANVYVT
jgi:hypothetical protein